MEEFVLTNDNYYSAEADKRYMSVHQYLIFVGHLGVEGCEAKAMAKLNGEYVEETTKPMLIGSYVDSYFEGTLDEFKRLHPEVFTQKKELKAEFKKAEKMIARCRKDKLFMYTMSGEKQKIFTAPLFGCEWKCKLDSYIPGVGIFDLKTSSDIHKAWHVRDLGYVCFIEYWGYTLQMAVYQKIVEICTGEKLPCYISVVTKDDSPEIKVVGIDQMTLDHSLHEVEMNMPNILDVKNGDAQPIRCEHCDWCRSTEELESAINMSELIYEQ